MADKLYVNIHQNFDNTGTNTLFIFGTAGETVTLSAKSGYTATATIGSNGSVSVVVPATLSMAGTGINQFGLTLASDTEISAYLSSRKAFTSDLSVIFQESTLGTEYVIASQGSSIADGGQFSVRAIEDDTEVTFTLPGGQTASVTLDAGDTFKFSTVDSGDNAALGITVPTTFNLTGTFISASAPVAVFSGAGCANVGDGACDHIVEQMPPIDALSTSYVVGEAFNNGTGNNLVRMVAASDGTQVRVNGSVVATLDRGAFHEFTLSDAAATITTSQPALVAQYLQGLNTAGGEGDPALSFVPGTETWLASYIVATPSGPEAMPFNLVNLIVPTAAIGSLTINGAAVAPALFTAIPGTDLSVANVDVTPGVIEVEADQAFQLSLFGYDNFDSFLTFGGANFASGLSNAPPDTDADAYTVAEDGVLTVPAATGVLANDTDADGDAITALLVGGPSDGTLTLNDDGSFTYTPNAGFSGTDDFTYRASDGTLQSGVTTVTITVGDDGGPPDPCPTVNRPGTQDGSAPVDEVLTGPVYHNTFFFDNADGGTGDDRITNFGMDDVVVVTGRLLDRNGDGFIGFGRNNMLDLGGGDTVRFDGPVRAVRYLGEACEGNFVYAAADVRPTGALEGYVLTDDALAGDAGGMTSDVFFFDTALDLDLGDDVVSNFGADDLLVTTTAIFDSDADEEVDFGGNGLLDLPGGLGGPGDPGAPGEGGTVAVTDTSGTRVTRLEFDGAVTRDGVTYYVYSRVGSSVGVEALDV